MAQFRVLRGNEQMEVEAFKPDTPSSSPKWPGSICLSKHTIKLLGLDRQDQYL